MGIIDTHCHLYTEEFDQDQETLIQTAKQIGIEKLLLPNVDVTSIDRMHKLADLHPEFTCPMMGLHPTSVTSGFSNELNIIESWLAKRNYCAIGEIGIDLYWDKTYLKEQKEVFEEQLRWSLDLDLPVAIHTRDAFPEVFDSIHKVGPEKLKGVFHSFTGTPEDLAEIKHLPDFMVGINGVITFKNAKLSETLQAFTIDRIVLETDAPYLSPVPYRGRRNEPAFIWKTAEKVAHTFDLSTDETVKLTRQNALKIFKTVNKTI